MTAPGLEAYCKSACQEHSASREREAAHKVVFGVGSNSLEGFADLLLDGGDLLDLESLRFVVELARRLDRL